VGSQKSQTNKKNSIVYLYSIFKNKSTEKIRACLDFKIFDFLKPFLLSDDITLKTESLNIFQEISLGAVDMSELLWLFGNNQIKGKINKSSKNDQQDIESEASKIYLKADIENYSMIQFLNNILKNNHFSILKFSDRFFCNKKDMSILLLREIARYFSLPTYLRPIIRILLKNSDQLILRLDYVNLGKLVLRYYLTFVYLMMK